MADEEDPKAEASAEKAYAAAAEADPNKVKPGTEADKPAESASAQPEDIEPEAPQPEPVDAPAKTKRDPEAAPAAQAPVEGSEPVAPPAATVTAEPPAKPALPKRPKPARAPTKVSNGRASNATAQPAKPVAPRSAPAAKSKTAVKKAAPKAAKPKAPAVLKTPKFKEQQMDNPQAKQTQTAKPATEGFEKVVSDTQKQAKSAFEKSTALIGEYTEFAKGNVEALLESGKILATGLQDMGSTLFAESRSAVETVSADAKQLAGAKSPAEFVKLQSEILRRNFDSAVALTSKNSEAVLKLASDSFAPISGRVSLAVEKLRKAA